MMILLGSLSFALLSKSLSVESFTSQCSIAESKNLFRNNRLYRPDYFPQSHHRFDHFLDLSIGCQMTSFVLFQSTVGDKEPHSVYNNNQQHNELAKLRKEYSSTGIDDENSLDDNPIVVFQKWLNEAITSKVHEPNAMCLATCDLSTGYPSARMVLLKDLDDRGFVWYTNYESRKGQDLQNNPKASLMFWWGEIERSVRIEGTVEKVSSEESDIYFNMRPPMARIGALASDQSRPIASRVQLDQKLDHLSELYLNPNGEEKKIIERPPQWGGYRLIPHSIEFWKGRASRIHDRIKYTQVDVDNNGTMISTWTRVRLQP